MYRPPNWTLNNADADADDAGGGVLPESPGPGVAAPAGDPGQHGATEQEPPQVGCKRASADAAGEESTSSWAGRRGSVRCVRRSAAQAAQAITRTREVVTRINDYQAAIAAAVEQQKAATGETTQSVAHAAVRSSEISANISEVARAAADTNTGIIATRRAAGDLSTTSAELGALVAQFRVV